MGLNIVNKLVLTQASIKLLDFFQPSSDKTHSKGEDLVTKDQIQAMESDHVAEDEI